VVDACECSNEPSGSIKCREFLKLAKDLLASHKGLCSMQLVSYIQNVSA
jgi:hypothetical protein